MVNLKFVADFLSRRCFVEAAYFGTVSAARSPTAMAHMLAGVGCCGCMQPLATAQRLLEGAPVTDEAGPGGLHVCSAADLIYEGFFHLLEANRLDPSIKGPAQLRDVFDVVADDLAYISRRELHTAPDRRRRYTVRLASVSAAVLIRRFTNNDRELPGVTSPTLEASMDLISTELLQRGGEAAFYAIENAE